MAIKELHTSLHKTHLEACGQRYSTTDLGSVYWTLGKSEGTLLGKDQTEAKNYTTITSLDMRSVLLRKWTNTDQINTNDKYRRAFLGLAAGLDEL